MDTDEKVAALKKAYEETIFNMSRESAARVTMSARKVVQLEHDLKVAKVEGAWLLVRLKQMMNSKVMEAEATALNQQKKIDELQAQVHEARDIIRDLREALREKQAELEMLKNDVSEPLNGPDNNQVEMEKSLSGIFDLVKNDKNNGNMSKEVKDMSKTPAKTLSELEKISVEKLNATSETEIVRIGEKIIKYTYQRRQKTQALKEPGVDLSSAMEKKRGGEAKGHEKPEPPLSVLLKESRERKKMAKGACQLIALSEDKREL